MPTTPSTTPEQFRALRARFDAKKIAWKTGHPTLTWEDLQEEAQHLADLANEHSRALARKYNQKPRLVTSRTFLY